MTEDESSQFTDVTRSLRSSVCVVDAVWRCAEAAELWGARSRSSWLAAFRSPFEALDPSSRTVVVVVPDRAPQRGCVEQIAAVLRPDGIAYVFAQPRDVTSWTTALTTMFDEVDAEPPPAAARALASPNQAEPSLGLVVRARNTPAPHAYLPGAPLDRSALSFADPGRATFVVPIHNEEHALPQFLDSLRSSGNFYGVEREFIFVLSACTDGSERIVMEFVAANERCQVVRSQKGIVAALCSGMGARRLDGYVGKLDSDSVLGPEVLDRLHLTLSERPGAFVTYAEPRPINSAVIFNRPDHIPGSMTRRLYFNGKASLYRSDPLALPGVAHALPMLRAEDVFMSFYLAYFGGADAIALAPGAEVGHRTFQTYSDLVRMLSRTRSEIERIGVAYPPFLALSDFMEQRIVDADYREVHARAAAAAFRTDDWLRLGSTK